MRTTTAARSALPTAVLLAAATFAAPEATAASPSWTVTGANAQSATNARRDGDAIRIASDKPGADGQRTALVTQPARTLATSTNAFVVTTDADTPPGTSTGTDLRGKLPDGTWTEWLPPKGNTVVLPVRTTTVQTRIVLTAPRTAPSPTVRSARVTQRPPVDRTSSRADAAKTYSVYATREGHVGGTTANGHVITERDHFVALPSRRALSGAGDGDYSVRVCADDRCEWAPVWDVGPWNSADNYWDDARESFADLPQGTPEAQAAYEDGYHGGTDNGGRKVTNPAGIDLADGTFYDGLGLTGNAWVQVSYSWTGDGPSGTVDAADTTVPVRQAPRSNAATVGDAADTARVKIDCRATGDRVDGTPDWYRIGEGYYVPAAFVAGASDVPDC